MIVWLCVAFGPYSIAKTWLLLSTLVVDSFEAFEILNCSFANPCNRISKEFSLFIKFLMMTLMCFCNLILFAIEQND